MKLIDLDDYRRKLTQAQRDEIKQKYDAGGETWKSLAAQYNVSRVTIGIIVSEKFKKSNHEYRKKTWKKYRDPQWKNTEYVRMIREKKSWLY